MRIRLSVARRLAAALIMGGLLSLPAHAAGRKVNAGNLVLTDDLLGGSAASVKAKGGAFTLDGTLAQVAASTSGRVAAPVTGLEAGYLSMMATTPVNSSFLLVSTSAVTVQWSVSNPTGTLYTIYASTASDYSGTVFSTSIYNSTTATLGGLRGNATYYFRYLASYMEGDETDYHPLGSTRTLANLPAGCLVGFNVKLDGTEDFTSIQAAVNALPVSLTVPSCVVVRDTQTYIETVTVEGFANSGSSITIMADPAFISSRPTVSGFGTAVFEIKNASVNVQGFTIRPFAGMPYGIFASSPNVSITSVGVLDAFAFINTAGVVLASYSSLSYSSVAIQGNGSAVQLGGNFSTVSYSTMVNSSFASAALKFLGVDSNTVTRGYISNMSGSAVYMSAGSDNNAVSQSTMITSGAASNAVAMDASDGNTITGSYIGSNTGYALFLNTGSDGNAIGFSTMATNGFGSPALYLVTADSNTVTNSMMQNSQGTAAVLDIGSDHNSITRSTMATSGAGSYALFVSASASNTVTGSYLSSTNGPAGRLEVGADYNTITQSTLAANVAGSYAMDIVASSSFNVVSLSRITNLLGSGVRIHTSKENTISSTTITVNAFNNYALNLNTASSNTVMNSILSNGSGNGVFVESGSERNVFSRSSITVGGASRALWIDNSSFNTVHGSYISSPVDISLLIQNNANFNTVSQSTMASNGAGASVYALDIQGASSNTVTGSWMSNPLGYAAFVNNLAAGNTISLSTITSAASGVPALLLANSILDTISGSYIQGSTAAVVQGSTGTIFSTNMLVATSAGGSALALQQNTGDVRVASSTLRGGASGTGLLLDSNNAGVVAVGSVTFTGSARGMEIWGQNPGFALAVDSITFRGLTPGATGIHFVSGPHIMTIALANFEDTSVGANVSAAALVAPSAITMFSHYGVRTSTAYENDPSGVVGWESGPYPGCVVTRNVGAGQRYSTIAAGVAALPPSLTGHSCVVIRDNAVYPEQVLVEGFTNNGSSISIIGDPELPGRANVRSGFVVFNASVNIVNVTVAPNVILNTGIFVSSPNVTISSVSVLDTIGNFTGSGIQLSSWTTVSYSSVIVSGAYAFFLPGSTMSSVSHSTGITTGGAGKPVVYLDRATSNTLHRLTAETQGGGGSYAVRVDGGAYNTISRSSFTGGSGALYLYSSSYNAVGATYMFSPNSSALKLDEANLNTVTQSTASSSMAASAGTSLSNSSSNTLTGLFSSNQMGYGAIISGGSFNSVSQSTFNAGTQYGLYLLNTASNSVAGSHISNSGGQAAYLQNSSSNSFTQTAIAGNSFSYGLELSFSSSNTFTGVGVTGARFDNQSNNNVIWGSTFTRSSVVDHALYLPYASSTTIMQSFITNPVGYALSVSGGGFSNYNAISQSTITTNSGTAALMLSGSGNTLSQDYIANANPNGYAAYFNSVRLSTVLRSTVTNSALNNAAMYLNGSSTNTFAESVIANATGDGFLAEMGSDWNLVSRSVVRGGVNGVRTQMVTGLYVDASTAIGGTGAGIATGITGYLDVSRSYVEGSTGVYMSSPFRASINSSLIAGTGVFGAGGTGVWSGNGTDLTMSSNTILGGGYAGLGIDSAAGFIRVSTNTVIARTGQFALGVGGASPTAVIWVTSNTIVPALSAAATTYGVYLNSLPGGATIQNNTIVYRTAGAAFAGVGAGAYGLYATGSPGVKIVNNRISNPSMVTSGNFIGASLDTMTSPIFKFNDLYSTGGSLTTFNLVRIGSTANSVFRNNILSSSMTATSNRLVVVDVPSQAGFSSDYNTYFSSNSSYSAIWGTGPQSLLANWITNTGKDANSLSANPRWVDPAGGDFHPLSREGRWNGTGFVQDAIDGPGLDQADPADGVIDEIAPNGARANQGSYGQTAEGSQTVLPCPTTRFVRQAGDGDSATLQGGVDALPNPLTSHSCVVVGDSGIYDEQINVPSFITNGSSITIMADPRLAARPTVRRGFVINSASVSIVGLDITPLAISINYGIQATAPNVSVSSVSILDASGFISVAGVALSSFSAMSNSSISVQGAAHGLRLDGHFAAVSNSTITSNGAASYALFFNGADTNTVTGSFISNAAGVGTHLLGGADYNTISLSTMLAGGAGSKSLYLSGSAFNTVTNSHVSNPSGPGAVMDGGSIRNTISLSTMAVNDAVYNALYLSGASSNTVTGSVMTNWNGGAAYLDVGSDYNTITLSTISSVFNGGAALFMAGAEFNVISACYVTNTTGHGARLIGASNYNTISQCAVTNNAVASFPLYMTASSSNTITGSLFANPNGLSVAIETSNNNLISFSTITTGSAASRALSFTGSEYNTVTRSFMSNPAGEGVRLQAASNNNTISFSTMTGDGAESALIITGSERNTIQNSYIQGSTAVIVSGANATAVNASVIVATNTSGGAVVLDGGSVGLAMSSNTIITGAQGTGVFLDANNSGTITLSTNTIRGGLAGISAYGQQAGTTLWITSNTIVASIASAHRTFGIYLDGLTTGATIQNNAVVYRTPGVNGGPTYASAIHVDNSDGVVITRNRISNPGMISGFALGVGLSNTNNTLFTYNDVHSTGTAIEAAYHMRLINAPATQLRNNVFSSSWTALTSSTAALFVDAASQPGFDSDYNAFFSSNAFNAIEWGAMGLPFPWAAAIARDANSVSSHPRWKDVSPGVEDFHHLSQAGRWNGTAFVLDGYTSDLIDKGSPADSSASEAAPNGSRPNLGSYGGTAEASKSPAGPTSTSVAAVFTSSISVAVGLIGADGYIVYASTASNFSGTIISSAGTGASTPLAPQGLTPNTTYFVNAVAVWGDFRAFATAVATATLANPPATAFPAFTATSTASLTVGWNENGNYIGLTTYTVVMTTGSAYPNAFAGNRTVSTAPAGAGMNASVPGLAPNTTYFAFAAAVNWSGRTSDFAALGSTSTLAPDPETAVSTFTNVGFSSFSVIWNAAGSPLAITTYTVQVSTAGDFNAFASSVSFSTVPAFGPSATFTGLLPNEIYFFRVRALNHNGVPTAYALLGSTETRPVTLQAPAIAGITAVSSASITATWGLSALATGYTLVASLSNDPAAVFASSAPVGINATTATVSAPALSANTTYFLFVRATGPGAQTGFSAYPATSTLADVPATAVSTFSSVFTTSMTVSWLPGGNPVSVTSYTVILSTGATYPNAFAGNRTVSTAPAGAALAASVTGLADNTAYFLHIAAVNHNGVGTSYAALGSTVTMISAPSTVVFDEISSNTIVASAYAPTPSFSNLGTALSGTRVAKNNVYSAFHGEAWASATALPTALHDAAVASYAGKLYVTGGFSGGAVQSAVKVYDPATGIWTSLAPLPSTRGGHAAAVIDGKIYAVGGTQNGATSLALNQAYDPAANSWTTKTPLPTASDHLSAVAIGGALYAFAGVKDGADDSKAAQYDAAANAWTSRPDFPATRYQTAAAAAAGTAAKFVVAMGGSGPSDETVAYDSALNAWFAKAPMPAPVEEGSAASIGGKLFVLGGAGSPAAMKAVYEFDPASNVWTTRADMTTGRARLFAAAAGGRVYALGGSVDSGGTSLTTVEEYDPGTATKFAGLAPNTFVNFKAQARNQAGTLTAQTTTVSTWTLAALPAAVASPFTLVATDSITFSWALNGNPPGTEFKGRASTSATFGSGAAILSSDWEAVESTSALTLTPNTTYFFQSAARNGSGGIPGIPTDWTALGSTATLAVVPLPAAAPFVAGTNALTVSWLPNGNPLSVTTYTVVLSTEGAYPNANTGNVLIASTFPAGALPTASLAGLVANTTYFAFASAVNHNGVRTAYAALGSTATLTLTPAAASPAFANVGQSSATFSWLPNGNPVGVTTYSVVLSTGAAFNSFAGNVAFTTSPAGALPAATAPAGLNPNTTYYGYAAAINWNGAVSAYASLGSTATLAAAPSTAITTFTAVHISSLTVSWSASGNPLEITTYTVQLSTAADFNAFATSFAFATAPASGPSATFTGLSDFTEYYFRVRAFNHAGTGTAFVALGSTKTLLAPLDAPELAGFKSVDITSVTATWGLVAGATGYTLAASLLPANPPTAVEASSTTFSIAATTAAAFSPALTPNTTYFLFVRANGPLRSSPYAAYGATSTLSSPPSAALTTFTGVGITSFTVSWGANGNALAITTYTVQLSTAADFNAFATSVTFTTAPAAGPSAMLTGLSGDTSYYLRIRSVNNNGVPSAYVNLGSTLTVASPLFPTVLNSQAGDAVWRRNNAALYSVAFLDTSGSHLDKFQVKASTTAGGLGSDLVPYTDVVVGLNPSDTYNTPWALPAAVFNGLLEGVTNYISIKVFNGPPLNNFTELKDAFYVQKDTTAPVIVNTQAGDSVPRSAAGTTYTVAVNDPSSGLAALQYSASLNPGTANAALIGWTSIAAVANTTSYATPWTVNFAALASGVTNYISVRSWDVAGATTTVTDAFFIHKDTAGPAVAITVPQTAAFYSGLTTFSGTAASIYGVQGTEVSVLDVLSGFYWNPDSLAFNSAAPIMMAATGGAAWTLSPGIAWVDGASYRAVARSSTTAGLYSTTYATSTFIMDLSKPTVAVLAPVPNSTVSALPVLSGTAADPAPNPSGVSSAEVRLRRNTDGLWWNWFTNAWGATAVSSITAGTTAWSLSPNSQLQANLASGTSYFIAVRASDNALPANQGDFFVSGATFTWQDTTPPAAVADLAASHGAVPGTVNLLWTAQGDDGGAGSIALGEYRIFYSTDIAATASTAAAQVVIATAAVNPGDAQAYTLTGLTPGVTYYVSLALADSDANWSAFSNQGSTTAAPSPLNAITGHVVDISTIGITAVQVDCWNASDALVGTTFTLADGSGTFSVDSLPAGSYKLRVTWTVNGFSSSLWQDGIAMGSTNVDFFLEINYALATLTGTLGTLTSSSFGTGGLGTASASDSFIELFQQGRKVARTTPKPTGRWEIPGLLPGTYSVRAFTGLGYTPFQDVTLAEGEVRVLGFVFDPLPAASVFAFPNPARTSTTIRFETALAPLEAGIYIFDIAGNLVKEISDSQISRAAAPVYRVDWDLHNGNGRAVAPGVYNVMVKVKGGSENQAAKVIKKLAVVR